MDPCALSTGLAKGSFYEVRGCGQMDAIVHQSILQRTRYLKGDSLRGSKSGYPGPEYLHKYALRFKCLNRTCTRSRRSAVCAGRLSSELLDGTSKHRKQCRAGCHHERIQADAFAEVEAVTKTESDVEVLNIEVEEEFSVELVKAARKKYMEGALLQVLQEKVQRLLSRSKNGTLAGTKELELEVDCKSTGYSYQDSLLKECLNYVRLALGIQADSRNACITVKGEEATYGMLGSWILSWTGDGRFFEEFDSEEMTAQWARDLNGVAWEADASGYVSQLDLDDRDLAILSTWVRTGFWLMPGADGKVQMALLDSSEVADELASLYQDHVFISVEMPGRKVKATVAVNRATWLADAMRLNVYGGSELWTFQTWQPFLVSQDNTRVIWTTIKEPTTA